MDEHGRGRGPHSPADTPATGADAPQPRLEHRVTDASTGPERSIDEAPGAGRLIDEDLPASDARVDARAATLGADDAEVATTPAGMSDLAPGTGGDDTGPPDPLTAGDL